MLSTTAGGPVGSPVAAEAEMLEASPHVSVVIPCYNLGPYLREAVDSIWAQTLRGIEIVIVNDGSTETATLDVLQELEQEGGVQVLHTANQGVARPLGILA